MFAPITYSPLNPEAYRVDGVQTCEVAEILKLNPWEGVWNFFWLVNPAVDKLPGSGPNWWKEYTPTDNLLRAVTSDVLLDEVVARRVVSHPRKFADWWIRQDYSMYDVYDVLPEGWHETVLARAHEAIERLRSPVIAKAGNVVTANFGRKVA